MVTELSLNVGYKSIIMSDCGGRGLVHPKDIRVHTLTGQSTYYWWLKTETYKSAIT